MTKTHTFDDGVEVELDDDVEVEDFLEADADSLDDNEFQDILTAAEAEEEADPVPDHEVEEEPDGVDGEAG